MTQHNPQIFERLHEQSFFLFGVLISLAFQKVLETIVPHLLTPLPEPPRWEFECIRLLVFLVVSVRFFLSTVVFFSYINTTVQDTIKENKGAKKKRKEERVYAYDLLLGLAHFLLFFIWAFTIDAHSMPLWLFPAFLVVILLYDCLWLAVCYKYDRPHNLMKNRVTWNMAALIGGALFYFIPDKIWAERAASSIVLIICVLDIIDLTGDKWILRGITEGFWRQPKRKSV